MRVFNVTGVKVSTAAATTPVSLSDVKDYCRLEGSAEDSFLTMLIEAATDMAESFMRRKIVTQTLQATYDYPKAGAPQYFNPTEYQRTPDYYANGSSFYLPYPPVQSITNVKIYDLDNTESTYSASNYFLDATNGRICFNDGYADFGELRERNAAIITYVVGYSTVPSAIKIGILEQIKTMYECRGVCDICEGMSKALRPYRIIDMLGY